MQGVGGSYVEKSSVDSGLVQVYLGVILYRDVDVLGGVVLQIWS